jgi:hypothetical protein
MRSVSIQELCERAEMVITDDVLLIVDGTPIAMMLRLHDGEDAIELERLIRCARAEGALQRIRDRAWRVGLDSLTMDEIDSEIAAARAERQS